MSTSAPRTTGAGSPARRALEGVTIRLAGDSGDGIQLTGGQMTLTSALFGNDIATLPDYPAEIRAPAGTLPGVSGFQLQFSSHDIMTAGDRPDVLVAFNPAALKVNLGELKRGGILIVNKDTFVDANLKKAGYAANPLEDGSLDDVRLFEVSVTKLTREALKESGLTVREIDRCKNFFALGMLYWLFNRPLDTTVQWLRDKFRRRPELAAANESVLRAGYNYALTIRMFQTTYEVAPASLEPGTYRHVDGNEAASLALAAIARKSGLDVFLGSYPITPASTVLHRAGRLKAYGVTTFQGEDEIASIGAAVGASFAGALGVTTTSGPGFSLKSEILGLAVAAELPLLVINVQRAAPSTGMPTKTEQADLLMALFGRHSEAPLPVLAPATPGDCFYVLIEAARLAIRYMTPVVVLSEGYLASGAEPWKIPDLEQIPDIDVSYAEAGDEFRGTFSRDAETLARPWIRPGTPGLENAVGGLEKDDLGHVSYDPLNHERMVRLREAKIAGIASDIPPAALEQGEPGDDLLVVGWGGTYGAITQAVGALRNEGYRVASLHLRHLNPLPRGLGALLGAFERVLVPELNTGQLQWLLKAKFLVDVEGLHKVQGQPFRVHEIRDRIVDMLGD